jgi:hypothetical protein
MDGRDDGTPQGSPSLYCGFLLHQPLLANTNQPKQLVASEGYRQVITGSISVNSMVRYQSKCAKEGSVTDPGWRISVFSVIMSMNQKVDQQHI